MPDQDGGKPEIVFDLVLNGKAILTNLCEGDKNDLLSAIKHIRTADRKRVLEMAAKIVCARCRNGEVPFYRTPNWCHDVFICRADEIHTLSRLEGEGKS